MVNERGRGVLGVGVTGGIGGFRGWWFRVTGGVWGMGGGEWFRGWVTGGVGG